MVWSILGPMALTRRMSPATTASGSTSHAKRRITTTRARGVGDAAFARHLVNRSDRRMPVAHPSRHFCKDRMTGDRVVMPHDAAHLAARHVDFVVRQHRVGSRMHDEQRHGFGRDPLELLGPQFAGCRAATDEHGIGGAAVEHQLPFSRLIGEMRSNRAGRPRPGANIADPGDIVPFSGRVASRSRSGSVPRMASSLDIGCRRAKARSRRRFEIRSAWKANLRPCQIGLWSEKRFGVDYRCFNARD